MCSWSFGNVGSRLVVCGDKRGFSQIPVVAFRGEAICPELVVLFLDVSAHL